MRQELTIRISRLTNSFLLEIQPLLQSKLMQIKLKQFSCKVRSLIQMQLLNLLRIFAESQEMNLEMRIVPKSSVFKKLSKLLHLTWIELDSNGRVFGELLESISPGLEATRIFMLLSMLSIL